MAKEPVKTITWDELLTRVEKNQGLPKSTVSEAFKGVKREHEQLILDERPTEEGGITLIKTPISCTVVKHIPKHIAKDSKGVEYEFSASYGVDVTGPREWVKIANTGFECTKKRIEK